jgi:uncharacterized protein
MAPLGATAAPIGDGHAQLGAATAPMWAIVAPIGASTAPIGARAALLGAVAAPIGAAITRIGAVAAQIGATPAPIGATAAPVTQKSRLDVRKRLTLLAFCPRRTILAFLISTGLAPPVDAEQATPQLRRTLARAAAQQVGVTVLYDPAYQRLAYPNGDLPVTRGVCADVVVRAFRKIGVDLQIEVHEDMKRSFAAYPRHWGLTAPDPNIDHRRVPNLMKYFDRQGKRLPSAEPYEPGDVVAFRLPGGLYHIGVVAEDRVPGTGRPYMIHNIGAGARKEDILYSFEILGHYRW